MVKEEGVASGEAFPVDRPLASSTVGAPEIVVISNGEGDEHPAKRLWPYQAAKEETGVAGSGGCADVSGEYQMKVTRDVLTRVGLEVPKGVDMSFMVGLLFSHVRR